MDGEEAGGTAGLGDDFGGGSAACWGEVGEDDGGAEGGCAVDGGAADAFRSACYEEDFACEGHGWGGVR